MLSSLLLLSSVLLVSPLNEDGLEQLISQNRGSVLVINFWATWCGPCRDEFPDLVKLSKEKKSQGLKMVSISMDEPEDIASVRAFLKEQNALFPSFIRDFEDFEDFVNRIDPDWSGALPATFIFDRNGEKSSSHVGKITYTELVEKTVPLLEICG